MNHFTPGWSIFPPPYAGASCYEDSAELILDYGGEKITIPFSEIQVCIEELHS